MSIQRYKAEADFKGRVIMNKDPAGDVCYYADHQREVAALRAKVALLCEYILSHRMLMTDEVFEVVDQYGLDKWSETKAKAALNGGK